MANIILLEHADFLRARIENTLKKNGYTHLKALDFDGIIPTTLQKTIIEADLLIVDFDSHQHEIKRLIELIKNYRGNKLLPILIMTSSTNIENVKLLLSYGMIDILLKPYDDSTLLEKVNKLLTRKTNQSNYIDSSKVEGVADFLNWNSGYEIGVETIDKEHKEIIDNFEKLYSSMKDGHGHEYFDELSKFLDSYVHEHFMHEEELQTKIGYDQIERHKVLHKNFIDKLSDLLSNHTKDTVTNLELIKLNLFIKDWLLHHIMVEDKKIGEFLNRLETRK